MSRRKSFPLRIPHELYEEVQKLASKELRSVNGQMEYLLTFAIRQITKSKAGQDPPSESTGGDKSESSS